MAHEAYAPGRTGPHATVEYRLAGKGVTVPLTYEVIDGLAVMEGDIILGMHADMASAAAARRECRGEVCTVQSPLIRIAGENYLWPGGVIPYEIDDAYTTEERESITTGIVLVEGNTNLILKSRDGESDYIRFTRVIAGCSSPVGRQGGRQNINIQGIDDAWCPPGAIAHEILHAAGIWHEQSREDRDSFVRILLQNVQEDRRFNFDQHVADGIDIADYDYGSIMHYGPTAFGRLDADGNPLTTIEVLRPGAMIGQRAALSAADIAGVNSLYTNEDCIYFDPERLSITAVGSQWRLDAAEPDGSTLMLVIAGDTRTEADRTLAIARHYRFDQVCFVGRPDPSTMYFLSGGSEPSGAISGEDCLPIDPAGSRVVNDGGWMIVVDTDGHRRMMASFPNPGEAYRTLDIWRQRNFSYMCYVGRPDPEVTYYRR